MEVADYNFIYNNRINDYELNGAFTVKASNYNTFSNNSVKDSKGKRLLYTYYSFYNTYYRNTFESSTEFHVESNNGVVFEIDQADNNMFYLNNIGVKELSYYSSGIWSLPVASYTYNSKDFSGPENLGNFHKYPSDSYKDTNLQDGIVDTVYDFNETTWYDKNGEISAIWGDDNEQLENYYPLAAAPEQYTFPVLWLNGDKKMYKDENMEKLSPGNAEIAPKGSVLWIKETEATPKVYSGTGVGQLVFIEPPNGNFKVEIGTSSDGTSWGGTAQRTATLSGDGTKNIITFETIDPGGSFTVGQNEYLAVRITNNTDQAYNLLTGGAWSYVSIKESEGGGISSVSPADGFTAGEMITVEGAGFGNSEGQVMFGDKEAGYNVQHPSYSKPYISWTDNKIECLAPAYDAKNDVVLKVKNTAGKEFTHTVSGFKYKGPWVSFTLASQDDIQDDITEGNKASFTVIKNPVNSILDITVPFTVSGTYTKHNLQNGNITILKDNEYPETKIFSTYDDGVICGDPGTVTITMGEVKNAVKKDPSTHTITVKNKEICVGDTNDIQTAIDEAAADKDAHIYVTRESYKGNITVDRPDDRPLTLESLSKTEIGNKDNNDPVILVKSDNVTIKGFKVSVTAGEGIKLDNVGGCTISDNECNSINDYNYITGILVYKGTGNNTISNNICSDLTYGISIQNSDSNKVSGNTCSSSSGNNTGIFIYYGKNNTVSGNTCSKLTNGIWFQFSDNNKNVFGNTCYSNTSNGIYVQYSDSNTVSQNTCYSNLKGIHVQDSDSNGILKNTCYSNTDNNIFVQDSENNIITGDIDGDQDIDLSDIITVLKILTGAEVRLRLM